MIGLLATLARLLVLAIFTFLFVVLYEHGPSGFAKGVPSEWNSLVNFVKVQQEGPAPAAPASEPAS